MSGDISPEEQQARWLEEGKAVVKQQAFLMFSSLPLHPLCILYKLAHDASISPRTHISSYALVCVFVCRYGGDWSACLFLFASDAPLTACQEPTQTPLNAQLAASLVCIREIVG